MNRYQKLAWWNIIVITASIVVTTAIILIEIQTKGYSTFFLWGIGILVLMRFNPFLFKKPKGQDTVVSDERDELIVKRAATVAYTTFWIVLVAFSMAIFWSTGMGPKSTVPAITLPLMVLGGGILMKLVGSVAILVQYSWGIKGEKS